MPALGPSGALSPNDWGAQVNYDAWRDLFSPDDGVAAHHGGGFDYQAGRSPYSIEKEAAQLRSWEQTHLNKGWRGLAYGWGVGLSGATFRIRGWARYGAHTGDVDGDGIANNDEIVPFIIIGSGHHHTLTPEAEAAIVRLRRFIEEGSPDATYLYGHQELRGIVTSCPGPNFMAYVRNHRLLEDDMPSPKDWTDQDWDTFSERAGWGVTVRRAGQDIKVIQELADIKSLLLAGGSSDVSDADLDAAVQRLIEVIPDRTRAVLKAAL